ncbi:VirB3 family type IV secretion system protein [Paraburkholderia sp. A1RI-2L]|uniref:VirB3 family type IV secretion system protein n=1 Tax=Paraburkholderia sp. A1RI-2L TaxID=3028367 RepID=UPI003B7D7F28
MDELPVRPVHRSLARPQMMQGGERELTLSAYLLGIGTGFACIGGFGIVPGLIIGIVLTVALLFVAKRMGDADPNMSKILRRHFKYQSYYPAHARIHSITPQVYDFK